MSARACELTLACLASRAEAQLLGDALCDVGYSVRVVDAAAWLDGRQACPAVVLFGECEWSAGAVRRAARRDGGHIALGVFAAERFCWDADLLSSCREFVQWPCPGKELQYRLKRVCAGLAPRERGTDESRRTEEYVGLNIVGRSPKLLAALEALKKLARYDVPIFIEGETGTGKELAARAIHYLSERCDHPFIPVNCGAVPDELFANELFGHERGAFTDARNSQPGLVAQASGGTLFLDEVDTLSLRSQVLLLRFLQNQEYRPLGSKGGVQADVRIVSATNAAIPELVDRGRFRQDLWYRLNFMALTMPPLHDRPGDVELLARHFMNKFRAQYEQPDKQLDAESLEWLKRCDWPGNVRELEHLIHREFLLADGNLIRCSEVTATPRDRRRRGFDRRQSTPFMGQFNAEKAQAIDEFERQYLCWLMEQAQGNVSLAAKRAGKERRALGKLLKRHCIDRRRFAPE
jgi:DNA-binding NtrC family response regulator